MSSCARSAEQILVVFRQFTDSKVSPLAEGSPPISANAPHRYGACLNLTRARTPPSIDTAASLL